ncbi:MAG: ATP-binding protein [Chitinivibrionales bacterium]|nr:ATP-binding protein [Chitinivibrionales bacterium]
MVRQVIEGQKRELDLLLKQRYVVRKVKVPPLDNQLVKVIIGPRRAGKSFYSQHLAMASGPFGYINLDDERLVGLMDYDELTAEAMSVYDSPKRLLIDEIQNLPRWELWINRLHRLGLRLIITGSNAHLLSSELATHLTGRHERVILFPFSFAEYKDAFSGLKALSDVETASLLGSYLKDGGFPETTVTSINKQNYLLTLFQSTIYKDIVKRYRITAAESIENLGRYLLSNTGSEYSFRSLTRVVGCKSDMTVRKYLRFLEESFILFSVSRFSYKVKEQAALNKKIYAIDNGVISAVSFSTSPNTGRLAENVVAIALEKHRLESGQNYFFWKNTKHEEVDFVCMENGRVSRLLQVCWNMENPKTADRELHALLKAGKELRCDTLQIITERKKGKEDFEWSGIKAKIEFIPLWEWLLAE